MNYENMCQRIIEETKHERSNRFIFVHGLHRVLQNVYKNFEMFTFDLNYATPFLIGFCSQWHEKIFYVDLLRCSWFNKKKIVSNATWELTRTMKSSNWSAFEVFHSEKMKEMWTYQSVTINFLIGIYGYENGSSVCLYKKEKLIR